MGGDLWPEGSRRGAKGGVEDACDAEEGDHAPGGEATSAEVERTEFRHGAGRAIPVWSASRLVAGVAGGLVVGMTGKAKR